MSSNTETVNTGLTPEQARLLLTIINSPDATIGASDCDDIRNVLGKLGGPTLAEHSKAKAYPLDLLIDDFAAFSRKIEWAATTGGRIGPVTGFPQIDAQLCGALYPGLHVICGNTGAGKTAFALQVAAQCECPALFVSCEMSSLELARRIAARVTDTPLQKFKDPRYKMPASAMINRFQQATEAAPDLVIADSTLAFWDRAAITAQVNLLKQTMKSEHVLIVIDSLNSWASWIEATEYDRLNMALKTLRETALELECPILYTAEQSKTANRENSTGGDLGSSAPAGFRGIEYGAESVIGLRAEMEEVEDPETRKKKHRPKRDGKGIASVWMSFHKNRNGAPGEAIKMNFDGELQKFSEARND